MRRVHPLVYLGSIVTALVVVNVMYVNKMGRTPNNTLPLKQHIHVSLLPDSEHTVLSRIRFPDRSAARISGNHHPATSGATTVTPIKFTLGIASAPREEEYLADTIERIVGTIEKEEKEKIHIVVYLSDKSVVSRAAALRSRFGSLIQSGILSLIRAPENIYPKVNYTSIRRTYNDSPGRTEWRSKLVIDTAFLFAYCEGMSQYFINMEDDVSTEENFINKTDEYIKNLGDEEWSSLHLSEYGSIGRLYRTSDLPKLVDYLLLGYTRKPLDYLLHDYDAMQLVDRFKIFRREQPLVHHRGEVSSKIKYLMAEDFRLNSKFDDLKRLNPKVETIRTTMPHYQHYNISMAYYPTGSYFWGAPTSGDTIDLIFPLLIHPKSVRIVTGFGPEETEHVAKDLLTDGVLLASAKLRQDSEPECHKFVELSEASADGTLAFDDFDTEFPIGIRCLRIRVGKGQNSWLVVKVIAVES